MRDLNSVGSSLSRRALTRLGAGGLGLGLATRWRGAAAQEATPAMAEAIPPLVQAWAAAWTAGDRDALLALYTDDASFEEVAFGEVSTGNEAIGATLDREFAAFQDITVDVTNAFQVDGHAAAEVVFAGTYASQMPGGPPASGQRFSVRVAVIFDLGGERIRRETDYFDAYEFLVQLGALPAPAGEGTPMAATEGQMVQVSLTDMAIAPSMTTFTVGVPYTFIVKNDGQTEHEMVIEPRGVIDKPLEVDGQEAEAPDLEPGQTKTLTWTFTELASTS